MDQDEAPEEGVPRPVEPGENGGEPASVRPRGIDWTPRSPCGRGPAASGRGRGSTHIQLTRWPARFSRHRKRSKGLPAADGRSPGARRRVGYGAGSAATARQSAAANEFVTDLVDSVIAEQQYS